MENIIKIDKLGYNYGEGWILHDLSVEIAQGDFVAVIGPNGAGKSTLLRLLAGILQPTAGTIELYGTPLPQFGGWEKLGYVPQNPAKQHRDFPISVKEVIELGLLCGSSMFQKISRGGKKRVETVLERFYLQELAHRKIGELSGGQQQRVGIARAFAANPPIVLMDEPFSALDPMTRAELQNEIHDLQTKAQKTVVFVTHDMDEAIKLADRICIMEEGKITQFDTPENILKNPANDFVRNFIGPKRIWTSPEYIKTRDIMITDPVCCHPKMPIFKCIETMGRKKVDTLMLTDQKGRLFGVLFAESLIGVHDIKKPAEDFMYREFTSVGPDSSIVDLLTLFDEHHLSTLPVVNSQGIIEGLITRSTLINTLSRQFIADAGKEES